MNSMFQTPRAEVSRVIEKLERIASDLEERLSNLDDEISSLRAAYPPVGKVMEVEVEGRRWLCDGWRAIRDVWPEEYEPNEAKPDLDKVIQGWESTTENVVETHYALSTTQGSIVKLSHGGWVNRTWHEELTIGRGFTVHGNDPLGAVVYRDREGFIAADVMAVSAEEEYLAVRGGIEAAPTST